MQQNLIIKVENKESKTVQYKYRKTLLTPYILRTITGIALQDTSHQKFLFNLRCRAMQVNITIPHK